VHIKEALKAARYFHDQHLEADVVLGDFHPGELNIITEDQSNLIDGVAVACLSKYRIDLLPPESQRTLVSGRHRHQRDAGYVAVDFEMLTSTPISHVRPPRPELTWHIPSPIVMDQREDVKSRAMTSCGGRPERERLG
jgi:hypothetical protein